MEAVNNGQTIDNQNTGQLTISAELIAYIILLALAITLRFASLGTVPMTDAEAMQALPAYHAVDSNAPGIPQEASSVIVFWLQRISFTFFGGTEFAARLPGVIGGLVLMLMPLLFRSRIGRERSFLLSLTLAFSPIAFTAARFSEPTIWTMIFATGLLWAFWRYWEMPLQENALILAAFLAGMVFLSGASGLLLLIIFSVAGLLTVIWTVYTAPDELDSPGDDVLNQVRAMFASLPFVPMIAMLAGLTIIVSTGFLIDSSGFNVVAESLRQALQGFIQASPDTPYIFAIITLLTYEPALLVLAGISIFMMLGSNSDTVIDRFVIAWVLAASVLLLIYRGSVPGQSLFLVLPLSYLTARLISELLVNYMPAFLSLDAYTSNDPNDYIWIKWLVSLVMLAGLVMMSLYFATLGRSLLTYTGSFGSTDQQSVLLYARIGWFVIMGILLVVMYFLFASMWGNRNVLQGYGLGVFGFMLLMGMGTGWNTAVVNIHNAAELWYTTGIAPDAVQLRESLFDVSRRDTRGFPAINLVILRDEEAGVTGDGLIAWLVRDFDNARFVDSMGEVRQEEIMLLPQTDEDPDLGGSYVGQSFTIREQWIQGQLSVTDWISWYTHRKTHPVQLPRDVTVLWLRIDVYDGIPASERP